MAHEIDQQSPHFADIEVATDARSWARDVGAYYDAKFAAGEENIAASDTLIFADPGGGTNVLQDEQGLVLVSAMRNRSYQVYIDPISPDPDKKYGKTKLPKSNLPLIEVA